MCVYANNRNRSVGVFCELTRKLKILRLGLKAVTGPDSAEATEIAEWVRTEFTEKYRKLRSFNTGIILSAVFGKDEKSTIYFIFTHHRF